MTDYIVTANMDMYVRVTADDAEQAEAMGDELIAEAWQLAEDGIEASDSPVYLSPRYDDTEVERASD